MLIGIDIDGTLYDWTKAVNQAVVAQFGIPDPGPHTSWDYLKDLLGGDDRWAWIWSNEAAPYVFGAEGMLYDGCQRVVNDLCREHDVHFCTHRNPAKTGAVTARWLNGHFQGYRGLHVLDNGVSKSDVMDWDVFIDDKTETIAEFMENTVVDVLVPTRDWNAGYKHRNLKRFDRWADVPQILEAL